MIANALFSPALQKILPLLFIRVDEAFYLNEIIRLTGLNSSSVQRELNRLAKSGLIVEQRMGNMRRFQANHASAAYPELHGLIQKTFGLTGVLQNALAGLSPNLHVAFIYGTVAKGNIIATSDIDLLSVGDDITCGTLLATLASAEKTLGRKINATHYTRAEFLKQHQEYQYFLMRVMEQAKLFLIGNEDELRRLG
jgi:DNA-binding transcriptional ArsR family regulator